MKQLENQQVDEVAGGLDLRHSEMQNPPEPATVDPIIVVDYNPPQVPQS